MLTFTQRIIVPHEALKAAGVPHAFGGALALAWCTGRPRATIDIDINIFVGLHDADEALALIVHEGAAAVVAGARERPSDVG